MYCYVIIWKLQRKREKLAIRNEIFACWVSTADHSFRVWLDTAMTSQQFSIYLLSMHTDIVNSHPTQHHLIWLSTLPSFPLLPRVLTIHTSSRENLGVKWGHNSFAYTIFISKRSSSFVSLYISNEFCLLLLIIIEIPPPHILSTPNTPSPYSILHKGRWIFNHLSSSST